MICQLVKIKCSPSSLPGCVTQLGTGTVLLFSHPTEATQLRDKQKVKTQFQTTGTRFLFLLFTLRNPSNAFPVWLWHCNRQSALMRWPLVHIFPPYYSLHIQVTGVPQRFFLFRNKQRLPAFKAASVCFLFFCLFCMKLCFFVLLNWLKEKRQTCALCTLSPHCWALFFSSSNFRKALCSCRKGGQVQQLLKLTT